MRSSHEKNELAEIVASCSLDCTDMTMARNMLYRPIQNGMLTGLTFEGSAFDEKSVQVTYFATVVSYPLDWLVLDIPMRLRNQGGGDRWNTAESTFRSGLRAAIAVQAIPFMDEMRKPATFASRLHNAQTVQGLRAAAIAFARAGNQNQAEAVVVRLLPLLDLDIPWQAEIKKHLVALREGMVIGPVALKSLLDRWEQSTAERLKLNVSVT